MDPAGEELLLNYDESFWKLQKKALNDIESFRKAMQVCRNAIITL